MVARRREKTIPGHSRNLIRQIGVLGERCCLRVAAVNLADRVGINVWSIIFANIKVFPLALAFEIIVIAQGDNKIRAHATYGLPDVIGRRFLCTEIIFLRADIAVITDHGKAAQPRLAGAVGL